MLGRHYRVTRGDDFRLAVRRGRRIPTPHTVIHRVPATSVVGPRFGVIVSKAVGGAVVRNRVRRRIQAACAITLEVVAPEDMVVIRALPGAGQADWDTLRSEIDDGLRRAVASR